MAPVVTNIAVVIPHHNQLNFLKECLRSLQAQTLSQWEAIVVDDVSTEGDPETLLAELNDPRIRVIKRLTKGGPGAARNTGFVATNAELVLPMDADDCLEPTFLEKTKRLLDHHPNVDCVHTEFQLFGATNGIWRFDLRTVKDMLIEQWIPGPGTLMRKKFWESVGPYTDLPQLFGNEDWEFWIRAMGYGCRPMKIDEPLYRYRRHAESITAGSFSYRDYVMREQIYQMHRQLFDENYAGPQFRGEGFLNSATASMKAGQRSRAIWLAFRGLLVDPKNIYLRKLFLRTLTPEAVIRAVRPFRNRASAT